MSRPEPTAPRTSDSLSPADGPSVAASHTEPAGVGCLVRMLWLLLGPVVLVFASVEIAQDPTVELWLASSLFWLAALGMVGLRYADVTRLGGLTTNGLPADFGHFRRYAVGVLLIAAGLYALALLVRL